MTINCEYLYDERCRLAEEFTGLPKVPVCPDRCEKCLKHARPKAPNTVIASIALCATRNPEEKARVKEIVKPYIERIHVDYKTGKPINVVCEYAVGPRCLIAERIAGAQVTNRTDQACKVCLAATPPAGKNRVTVSLAISSLRNAGDAVAARKLLDESKSLLQTAVTSRISNWQEANRRWNAAGRPVRTDDEIKAIVEICEGCEHYNAKMQQCRLCGCFCRKKGMARFNKPKMATESCPIGKW